MKKYKVSYSVKVHPEGVAMEDRCGDPERGFCDSVVLFSILSEPDGWNSVAILSVDGETATSMPDMELFKAWILMAKQLSESPTLTEGAASFAGQVYRVVRDTLIAKMEAAEKEGAEKPS